MVNRDQKVVKEMQVDDEVELAEVIRKRKVNWIYCRYVVCKRPIKN